MIRDLDHLLEVLKYQTNEDLDRMGGWRATLPTFGGDDPRCTIGVWSWDAERVILGTCTEDLAIFSREGE